VYANYSIWGWVGASNNNNGPAQGLHTLKCGPAMHRDPMPCFPSLSESVWVPVRPMQLIDSVKRACWRSVGHCLWSAVCGQPSFDLLLLIYADDGRPALICCDKWWQFVHTDRCFAGLYTWNVARDHGPKMQDRNPRDHIIINFYLSKKFR